MFGSGFFCIGVPQYKRIIIMSALTWISRALKEAGIKFRRDIATRAVEAFVPVDGEQYVITFLETDEEIDAEMRFGPVDEAVVQQLDEISALFGEVDLLHDERANMLYAEFGFDATAMDEAFASRVVATTVTVARMVGGTLLRMQEGATAHEAFEATVETVDISTVASLFAEDLGILKGQIDEESVARTVALLEQLQPLNDPGEFLLEHLLEFDEDVMAVLTLSAVQAQAEGESEYATYLNGLIELVERMNTEDSPEMYESFLYMARLIGTSSVDEVRALAYEWPTMLESAFVDVMEARADDLDGAMESHMRKMIDWLKQVRREEPLLAAVADLASFETWEESRSFVNQEPLLQGRPALDLLDDLIATAEANDADPSNWLEHREWLGAVQQQQKRRKR